MGQVTRIADIQVEIDVEIARLTVMHAQVHDVATGLANDGAGLAQHARRILDRGAQAG